MNKIITFTSILIFHVFTCFAQQNITEIDVSSKEAKEDFNIGNFKDAQDQYETLLKNDSSNTEYKYKLGICYYHNRHNLDKAEIILTELCKENKADLICWYHLGLVLQLNLKYDDAIEAFKKCSNSDFKPKDEHLISAQRQIEMCKNALEIVKRPVDISFENLGTEINSEFSDYNAFVPADESFIIFSSKRDKNTGKALNYDGQYTSDIYFATQKNGIFIKTKNFGQLANSELIEETVGISPSGEDIYMYYDNYEGLGEIFNCDKKGKSFNKPINIGDKINTKNFEYAAASSADNSILVFSSNQPSGKGGIDLWYSRKLPTGEWGTSANIGDVINTEYDENYPSFSATGKTLYFASTGHNSMGGYDYFKTTWNDSLMNWSKPENLGYPLNTSDDNTTISFTRNEKYAYIAANRKDSYGFLDIYKVTFNDKTPSYTLVKGKIITSDSSNLYTNDHIAIKSMTAKSTPNNFTEDKYDLKITVQNKSDKTTIGTYRPNFNTGDYVMNLPTGNYIIIISGKGLQTTTDELNLPEKEFYKKNLTKLLIVQKDNK